MASTRSRRGRFVTQVPPFARVLHVAPLESCLTNQVASTHPTPDQPAQGRRSGTRSRYRLLLYHRSRPVLPGSRSVAMIRRPTRLPALARRLRASSVTVKELGCLIEYVSWPRVQNPTALWDCCQPGAVLTLKSTDAQQLPTNSMARGARREVVVEM